jgi:hypothetical protein
METKKNYNYYCFLIPISKAAFLHNVPSNWESELDEHGVYSYGGFKACLID